MYVPSAFAMDEEAAWHVVRDAGAGMLVVASPEGMHSVYVPVIVSHDRHVVLSHVAKANRWWRWLEEGADVLGLFLTASAYVSPSNYPSRHEHPGVVPTWNYVAAELRGRARAHDDVDWLRGQVHAVTTQFEEPRDPRWRVEDSPGDYIDAQLRAIVGIEIQVTSIQGKAKLSQNRPDVDHDYVRDGFAAGSLSEQIVAQRMTATD